MSGTIDWQLIFDNLRSPPIVAFVLGVVAVLLRTDLRLPRGLYPVLSAYLLLAIGLKGGISLAAADAADLGRLFAVAAIVGVVTPLVAFALLRVGGLDVVDAGATAAHYGSTSVVTFTIAQQFLRAAGEPAEDLATAILAVVEVVGIVVALLVVARSRGAANGWGEALREVVTGRSISLLVGGLVIGAIAGPGGTDAVAPLFIGLFPGILVLFLLEIGATVGERLSDLRIVGAKLIGLGIVIPLLNGTLGVLVAALLGLGTSGMLLVATIAASASYIAAPAAVRIALPEARPGIYLTAALAITFPFNIVLGIPLYWSLTQWVG
jgi:uncharacterized protein